VSSDAVRILLSRSFFLISVGSNDLFVFAAAPTDVVALYSSLISGYNTTITVPSLPIISAVVCI
jgi:hypothetical protein